MIARGITVTSEDLESFRKLLRFFFIEAVKENYNVAPAKETFLPNIIKGLDTHFWLEEPFISGQVTMVQSGADSGTLVISDSIFDAYKQFALYDIKSNYISMGDTKAGEAIVDVALHIQKRLVEVLDGAIHVRPGQEHSDVPQPSKQFMN